MSTYDTFDAYALNDYMRNNRRDSNYNARPNIVKRVQCADGFSMSVQAHDGAYCRPRIDGADFYIDVEVGFPSRS